jgi:hypothetical protein
VLSRKLIKRQPGRRYMTFTAAMGLLALTFSVAGSVLAVHDETFQLDGDVLAATTTAVGGTTQTLDWDSFFDANGGRKALPAGFDASDFQRDFKTNTNGSFNTGDDSTFATGSKDILPISGWQCNHDNNVNNKIDISNAYAAAYTATNGDEILYFALERSYNGGDANVGFWFLQDEVGCSSPSGSVTFTGDHTDGDLLIVSAFTKGGVVSTIDVYRWNGGANGSLGSTPVAHGADCAATGGGDTACATVNNTGDGTNGTITTPWLTHSDKTGVGHSLPIASFFEGGVNLTQSDLGGKCFSAFFGDTRSSQSLTATLFDFAGGTFGECETTLTTSAAGTANGNIGSGVVSSGTDTATLDITGTSTWGGTLTWYLCGPVTSDGCDSTGVQVTSRTVNQSSAAADFVSGTANLTSAGRYCWTAHFEPDAATAAAGVDPADGNGVGECFNVAAVTPTLTTSATCSANPCVLGSTLTDSASLTGTATQPGSAGPSTAYPTINPTTPGAAVGGTITWVLYAPSNGGCTDTRTTTPASRTVSGNGPYSVTYGTSASTDPVGTYTFVANYGGNSPNTNAPSTTNTCASPGANETVTVTGSATSSSAQRWLPNDRIIINSNGPAMNGTLTATLYSGTFSGTAANCTAGTATAVAGQSYSFTLTSAASGSVFQTTNTTYFVGTKADGTAGGANGNYFWLIHLSTQLDDPADRCEGTLITITD